MPYQQTLAAAVTSLDAATLAHSAGAHDAAIRRLDAHLSLLRANGITGLTGLGTLKVGGTCVPSRGILTERLQTAPTTIFVDRFRRWNRVSQKLEPSAGWASLLRTGAPVVPVADPYWAAEWIDLAAGTTVVLQWPQMYLTLIAKKITVGPGVTFTWQQPGPDTEPKVLGPPATPGPPPISDTMDGVDGYPGLPGWRGDAGANGKDAPTFDLWALQVSGTAVFDLRGQDGFPGGRGQAGGQGGPGSKGRPAIVQTVFWKTVCKAGPGVGGDGGPGGRGGDGGPGGRGGHGGRLLLQAPEPALLTLAGGMANLTGGAGGAGGAGGWAGTGGLPGQRGDNPHNCWTKHTATPMPGRGGDGGQQGDFGAQGADYRADARVLVPITAEEFQFKLTDPALVRLNPTMACRGDQVSVTALRLQRDDRLMIDGTPAQATVVSDTLLTFVVPLLSGGQHLLHVRRPDGQTSNKASMYVRPVINGTVPGGRLRPGSTVTVTGSGFAAGARVRVNGLDMSDVVVAGPDELSFTLLRPPDVAPDPAGERVTLKVALADGTESNGIGLVLDTYRVLVLGDSVMWGQGLQDQQKMHAQVAAAMQAQNGGMKAYSTVLAHSGAIIGARDTTQETAIDGEVPTSRPTILQQCRAAAGSGDTVDLVLLDGGINDIDVVQILDPTTTTAALKTLIRRACHDDMRTLLLEVVRTYPHAKVVVCGYFPIVTSDSDVRLLRLLLLVLGLPPSLLVTPAPGLSTLLSEAVIRSVISNATTFHDHSRSCLTEAVDSVNATLPAPRVAFADAGYGTPNAAMASDPWLFGINADGSPQDNPVVSGPRKAACALHEDRTVGLTCERASTGHPNAQGARRYASAILDALDWQVLATPKQLQPADAAITSNQDITVTWAPVAHATGYLVEVQYAAPPDWTFIDWLQPHVTDCSYAFRHVGMQPGRWRVTARADGYAASLPSPWRRFEIRPSPLPTPTLLSPADGASLSSHPRTTTLRWEPVTGAGGYRLEVQYAAPPDWAFVPLLTRDLAGCDFTFEHVGAQPGRWRVSARGAGRSDSPPSAWRTYRYTV